MKTSFLFPSLIVTWLSGCASYQPAPLPEDAGLSDRVQKIVIDRDQIRLPALRSYPFRPEDGLDRFELALAAISNNPGLRAKRTQSNIAQAALYSAGLLPDPQITVGLDDATNGGISKVTGFDLGLDYDIVPLITRPARQASAKASVQQVDLELTWAEWEVAQRVQSLAVAMLFQNQRIKLLQQALEIMRQRYQGVRQLMIRGDVALTQVSEELAAKMKTANQLDELRVMHNKTLFALHELLALDPDAPLPLKSLPAAQPVSRKAALQRLSGLATHRADLLALQAGYQSQEEKVRAAILAQFPSLQLGLTRGRDTDGLYTNGIGVNLQLPVFSGNRGRITSQRASREKLKAEYQARLDSSLNEIKQLLDEQDLLLAHRRRLAHDLPELRHMLKDAEKLYARGDMPTLSYLSLELSLIERQLEASQVEQKLWEHHIDLETLLADMSLDSE